MLELRCKSNKKYGVLIEPGTGVLEVKCNSRFCGSRSGVITLHEFDLATGALLRTRQFAELQQERKDDGADNA